MGIAYRRLSIQKAALRAVVVGIIWFEVTHGNFLSPMGTAFAVGGLIIDWNVPAGNPISESGNDLIFGLEGSDLR